MPRTNLSTTRAFSAQALACLLLVCGCQSTPESKNSLKSIDIQGNTPGQISKVVRDVFRENGYNDAQPGFKTMVFEKKASTATNITYGGWGATPLWMRVKIAIAPIGEAAFRISMRVYRVEDIHESTEQEKQLSVSGPYEKLLNEIAKRLGGKPVAPKESPPVQQNQ